MTKAIVETKLAPAAIGPYSQAVRAGSLLYVSGQIPLDPQTGELVGSDIDSQTRRVLDNLAAILKAGGSGLKHVIKTTIYFQDMQQFQNVNEIYGSYFKPPYPARATVEVARLPRNVQVEIDCIDQVV